VAAQEKHKPVGDVARDAASFAADRQTDTDTDTLSDNKGRLQLASHQIVRVW